MREPWFSAKDGTRLRLYRHEPAGRPRAHVYLLHGFGEHSGRYSRLAAELNGAGIALHALDHRGHGRSEGARARVNSPQAVSADYLAFLSAEPDRTEPVFLLGHSMGGPAAVQVALADPERFSGLVLSSPYLQPTRQPPPVLLAALRLLRRVLPGLSVERLSSADLSRQSEESDAYDADPLVHHGGVSAITASALLEAGQQVLARAAELQLPLLILHGARDAIAGIDGSRRLLAAAGSRDRRIVEFEQGFHELMNDSDREEFYRELLDWLEDRLEAD